MTRAFPMAPVFSRRLVGVNLQFPPPADRAPQHHGPRLGYAAGRDRGHGRRSPWVIASMRCGLDAGPDLCEPLHGLIWLSRHGRRDAASAREVARIVSVADVEEALTMV